MLSGPPGSRAAVRLLNVACRTVHLLAFAFLLGASAGDADPARVATLFWWTAGSGVALVGLELLMAGPRWVVEVRGLAVALKLALLGLVPWAWEHRTVLLVAAAVVASAGAHAPRWLRHAALWPEPRFGAPEDPEPRHPAASAGRED